MNTIRSHVNSTLTPSDCYFRHKLSPLELVNREEWLSQLSSMKSMSSVRVKDIDFRSDKFSAVVEKIGKNLTNLDLRDICFFRLVAEIFFLGSLMRELLLLQSSAFTC